MRHSKTKRHFSTKLDINEQHEDCGKGNFSAVFVLSGQYVMSINRLEKKREKVWRVEKMLYICNVSREAGVLAMVGVI